MGCAHRNAAAQLQAYYASGVKPEEIAQFLQAFGVVGIAIK